MKIEYYEEMLEQEAINKYLNMIANDYNGELAKIFQEKYINKGKENERQKEVINGMIDNEEKYCLEINKLKSIIKEVREYIKEWQRFPHTNGSTHKELKNLIDILDKEK